MGLEWDHLYSLGTDVAAFMFFHPDRLAHRNTAPIDWWSNDFAEEFRAGLLVAFTTGSDGTRTMKFVRRPLSLAEERALVTKAAFRYVVQDSRIFWDNSDALPSADRLNDAFKDENGWLELNNGPYRVTVHALDWFSLPDAERESETDISHYVVRFEPVESLDEVPVPASLPELIASKSWHRSRHNESTSPEHVRMEITWPPFPADVGLLDHPATEQDIELHRAAFVMCDDSGTLIGSPIPMGMTRLGFFVDGEKRQLGVLVQLEAAGDQSVLAVVHSDGTFSTGTPKEFDQSPRFLIFYRNPAYGLDQAEQALRKSGRTGKKPIVRKGNVLAVQAPDQTVVYIRHASREVAAQEIALLKKNEHASGLAACTSLFEVSFPRFEEVYDNALDSVQCVLSDELQAGYKYWGWNGTVEPFP